MSIAVNAVADVGPVQARLQGLAAAIRAELAAEPSGTGFQGSESVKASLREIRQVFGHPVMPHPIAVRAYTRTVDLPARPSLDPATVADAINRAIAS